MKKIYFDQKDRDNEVKSETFWSHTDSNKEEYATFFKNRKDFIEISSLENCDYILLPYKWKKDESFIESELYKHAIEKNKNILSFFNDDYDLELRIPNKNFFLFRTSTYRSSIKENEIIMPAFCETFEYIPPTKNAIDNLVLSFCGNVFENFRIITFQELQKNIFVNYNFLCRRGFWAPEISDKTTARRQFVDNMRDGLFGLCMRGNGNFSYRLYETLALGRIPVIINSDLKLPLENILDWKSFSLILELNEIQNLHKKLYDFSLKYNIEKICEDNKKIYEEYFSPHGFIKNIELYLMESKLYKTL
jgi:hypothetical protein